MLQIVAETTPNPNSMKFTLNKTVAQKGEFYSTPAQGEKSPLAKKLFGLPGVAAVFLLNNFVTITRQPTADWEPLVAAVKETLQSHFSE
ncbi:MAG: NifU N-terminal domain-containing protein [Halobacteria archaeon]